MSAQADRDSTGVLEKVADEFVREFPNVPKGELSAILSRVAVQIAVSDRTQDLAAVVGFITDVAHELGPERRRNA